MRMRIRKQAKNAPAGLPAGATFYMRRRMDFARIVKAARTQLGYRQGDFFEHIGLSQSTISRWERGAQPEAENWRRFRTYCLSMGVEIPDVWQVDTGDANDRTPLVGYVGAGASILVDHEVDGPLDYVPRPRGATERTVAVEVRGDSMPGQAEDGWLLYYDDRREPVTDDLIGELCVVGCSDGRVLVKHLYRGSSPGKFDLAPSIGRIEKDVAVDWAAPVEWIRPRRR